MWDENGRVLVQSFKIAITGSLLIIYRELVLTEDYPKIVLFDFHKIGLRVIFDQFSEKFSPTSCWLCNNAHFIRSVRQSCGSNILPYGPNNWIVFLQRTTALTWHVVRLNCTAIANFI